MRLSFILPAILLTAAAPCFAVGIFSFNINPPVASGLPGDTVYLSASMVNNTGATVFVNDLSVAFNSPADVYLSQDVNFFYFNVPGTFVAGASWTGDFMQISIDPSTPPGDYTGVASIIGGANEFATNPLTNILASQSFEVVVVPEPRAAALMAAGLALLAWRTRRPWLRS